MKKKITVGFLAAAAVFAAPQSAWAQLYKCKGPDGKVVYGDARCESSDKGALKVSPNSTTLSEREQAAADEAAKARDEAARDARLTSEQRSHRDSLQTDLSSVDAAKRRKALDGYNRTYF